MKVLHITEGLLDPGSMQLRGGLERSLFWLMRRQRLRGWEVELWLLQPQAELAARLPELREIVRGIPPYDHRRPDHLIRTARRLLQSRPDILHTHGYWSGALGRLAAQAMPLSGASRPVCIHRMASAYRREFRWTRRLTERLLARRTDRLIAVSMDVRRFLLEDVGVPEGKVSVVYNGAPEPRLPADRAALRRALGFSGRDFVIASLSRLDDNKGLPCLIEAAARVLEKFPAARLLIAGDGPMRPRLEAAALEKLGPGTARFMGWVAEPGEALGASDAFVLGSEEREGFSTALVQAMAARVPAVATAVGGNVEALEDGVTGLLIPPRDAGALADALLRVAQNREEAARMARKARGRYEDLFRIESSARKVLELYESCLRARGRAVPTPPA